MIYKKILKHGASVCVVIPAAWARHFNMRVGDFVRLAAIEDKYFAVERVPDEMKDAAREFIESDRERKE